jgi:hypothetical protein
VAIECKRSIPSFEPGTLRAFRARYPGGLNVLVTADAARPLTRRFGDLEVRCVGLEALAAELRASGVRGL